MSAMRTREQLDRQNRMARERRANRHMDGVNDSGRTQNGSDTEGTDARTDAHSRIKRKIRERLMQASNTVGYMDSTCLRYFAALLLSGEATEFDFREVGGESLVRSVRAAAEVVLESRLRLGD